MFFGKLVGLLGALALFGTFEAAVYGLALGMLYDVFHTNVIVPQRATEDWLHSFSVDFVRLHIKLAAADGKVTAAERAAFMDCVEVASTEEETLLMLYDSLREEPSNYMEATEHLNELCADVPNLKETVLGTLFYAAHADGAPTAGQRDMLSRVAHTFGVKPDVAADLEESAIGIKRGGSEKKTSQRTQQKHRAGNASFSSEHKAFYVLLGVKAGATNAEIKKAYRSKIREFHPDKIRGQGASEQEIQKAEQKMAEINEAYSALTGKNM